MAVATEAAIEAADGAKLTWAYGKVSGGTSGNTYEATLVSEDAYANALSKGAGGAWGDTDEEVFGGKLAQKMIHVYAIVGFWIGNRCGAQAAAMKKPRKVLGLAW